MAILIKLDEDLSRRVGEPLARRSIAFRSVRDQGLAGTDDATLFQRTRDAGEMLITADKGFGDVREYDHATHPGVIVLRPERDTVVELRSLVERLLLALRLDDLKGCLVVVSERSVRVRRPPGSNPDGSGSERT